MASRRNPPLGLDTSTLVSAKRATFTQQNNRDIRNFIATDPSFRSFAAQNSITAANLQRFDLNGFQRLLDCDGYEGRRTRAGEDVQHLLDTKLRAKLASEYQKNPSSNPYVLPFPLRSEALGLLAQSPSRPSSLAPLRPASKPDLRPTRGRLSSQVRARPLSRPPVLR